TTVPAHGLATTTAWTRPTSTQDAPTTLTLRRRDGREARQLVPTLALIPAPRRARADPNALMQTIVIPSPSRAWSAVIQQATWRGGHVEYEIVSKFTEIDPSSGRPKWTGTSVVRRRYR